MSDKTRGASCKQQRLPLHSVGQGIDIHGKCRKACGHEQDDNEDKVVHVELELAEQLNVNDILRVDLEKECVNTLP